MLLKRITSVTGKGWFLHPLTDTTIVFVLFLRDTPPSGYIFILTSASFVEF